MKKFITEKYADLILQVCTHYKNTFPDSTDRTAKAVNNSLDTLDKYSYYILGMGYMVETDDIPYLKEYITTLIESREVASWEKLADVCEYLSYIEREDVF